MARFLHCFPPSLRVLAPAAAAAAQSLLPGIGWRRSDDATPWRGRPTVLISMPCCTAMPRSTARCMKPAARGSAGEEGEKTEGLRRQAWSQMMHEKKAKKKRAQHVFRADKEPRAPRDGVIKKTTRATNPADYTLGRAKGTVTSSLKRKTFVAALDESDRRQYNVLKRLDATHEFV
mmetsp:Transcript_44772/g.126444  ORF Transcript_44772/g.126444 Transcript_44772/m.126444 type:complete len:176 (+) Transcript_44772:130-657(+)